MKLCFINAKNYFFNQLIHFYRPLVTNGTTPLSTSTTSPKVAAPNVTEATTTNSSSGSTTSSVNQRLPQKGSAEEEHHSSMAIFFVLSVIGENFLERINLFSRNNLFNLFLTVLCIFVIHLILQTRIQFIPESLAVVLLGSGIGFATKYISSQNLGDWQREEMFNPTTFFLLLLPPIMYESGYNLHKGNFFQNIGSILVFAIVGTTISALVIGGGIYILGLVS